MTRIGFIGIGQMGRWMSEHLLSAGYPLTVFDANPEAATEVIKKGAIAASCVQDLAERSEVVITMLPNSAAVEAVAEGEAGLFQSMKPGGMIIDMSSSYSLSTQRLAKKAVEAGLTMIDAPVSGGVKGAKAGNLTIMVGGSDADFARALPILQCMGKTINLVGETGAGHALKAINNYLSATSMYATAEAMILCKKLGLHLNTALETINQSSGQSFSTHYKFPTFVTTRQFNSGFSLELLQKDVRMVNSIARDQKIPLLLGGLVEQIYEMALHSLPGHPDHTEIAAFLERMTNITLSEGDS
ncbi:NAD(P)-dependent oxidoreductase [Brevibacillus massiliensis]|jgi:3-hydroxyisobutyrate dehydrogenase-like beta-hydroxyacid dehydrogenase|uniref:NAD(P)-dependent oxidoreductase n=1 Tax=Brevibacillus massiliensis TaxID=1118054 RepID=UPI000311DC53|nr:NAD(P)-dependent oxidoreductase [Brevibacillus massiliensis]